jgi:hypothetical protein
MTSRRWNLGWLVSLHFLLLAMLPLGCDATRRDWGTCWENPCDEHHVCNSQHQCVEIATLDASVDDKSASVDVDSPSRTDVSEPDRAPAHDTSIDTSIDGLAPAPDSAGDGRVDVAITAPADAAKVDADADADADGAVDLSGGGSVDSPPGDVPGSCGSDGECLNPGAPYCVQGQCVACRSADQCKGGGGTPICSPSHVCVSCAAVDAGCPSATPACEAASGRCLECVGDGDCRRDPGKAFCAGEKCVGCLAAGSGACAARDATKPACSSAGTCVECTTSNDCLVASKPICDTVNNLCVPCASDSACAAKTSVAGPGVCMAHQDHRCATDAETIYIARDVCAYAGPDGSVAHPFCGFDDSVSALSPSRKVMVVRGLTANLQQPIAASLGQVSIIGQNDATLSGIRLSGGSLYVRDVTVTAGSDVGISASNAATLRLEHVVVDRCAGGGILLDGAAFDIQNTTVTNSGPGQGTTLWGGILVQSLLSGGTARLNLVTLEGNNPTGLWCQVGGLQGSGVFAANNTSGVDIGTSCNITACSSASATCGAQP